MVFEFSVTGPPDNPGKGLALYLTEDRLKKVCRRRTTVPFTPTAHFQSEMLFDHRAGLASRGF